MGSPGSPDRFHFCEGCCIRADQKMGSQQCAGSTTAHECTLDMQGVVEKSCLPHSRDWWLLNRLLAISIDYPVKRNCPHIFVSRANHTIYGCWSNCACIKGVHPG